MYMYEHLVELIFASVIRARSSTTVRENRATAAPHAVSSTRNHPRAVLPKRRRAVGGVYLPSTKNHYAAIELTRYCPCSRYHYAETFTGVALPVHSPSSEKELLLPPIVLHPSCDRSSR